MAEALRAVNLTAPTWILPRWQDCGQAESRSSGPGQGPERPADSRGPAGRSKRDPGRRQADGRKPRVFCRPSGAAYHLPERSFLYLLHALREEQQSPRKMINAPDWRMFLMRPADVEHELLRLHQFRKLEYQVAGSLVQLTLPCSTSLEYAERMVT